MDEERKERAAYKQEKEDLQKKQHEDFRMMMERAREAGKRENQRAESSESDSENRSGEGGESLETYQSP